MDADAFSRRLKVARAWGGYSQGALGAALRDYGSFSRGLVGQWEQGKTMPAPKIIEAIAELCGVRVELLTDETFDPLSAEADSAQAVERPHENPDSDPQEDSLSTKAAKILGGPAKGRPKRKAG